MPPKQTKSETASVKITAFVKRDQVGDAKRHLAKCDRGSASSREPDVKQPSPDEQPAASLPPQTSASPDKSSAASQTIAQLADETVLLEPSKANVAEADVESRDLDGDQGLLCEEGCSSAGGGLRASPKRPSQSLFALATTPLEVARELVAGGSLGKAPWLLRAGERQAADFANESAESPQTEVWGGLDIDVMDAFSDDSGVAPHDVEDQSAREPPRPPKVFLAR